MFTPIIVPSLLNTMIIVQFLNFTLIIKKKYKVVNEYLSSLSTPRGKPVAEFLSRALPSFIELSDLGELYIKMYDVVMLICSTYGIPLLAIMLWLVTSLVAAVTFILQTSAEEFKLNDILNTSLFLLSLTALTLPCHLTVQESIKSSILLQKALLYREDKDRIQIERLLQQFRTMKVQFSVCGFFRLDLPLLCGILGIACTYVAVIAQVQ